MSLRYDLVLIIFGMPFVLGMSFFTGILAGDFAVNLPISDNYIIAINMIIMIVALIFEVKSLCKNNGIASSGDSGVVSAIISIIVLLYVPALDRYVFHFFIIVESELYYYLVGVAVILLGIYVRRKAVVTLGRHFNHSLIIIQKHELIDDGLYRLIRHPAYLGTLLLMLGSSWMFLSYLGSLFILMILPFVIYRISNEEKLLLEHFGSRYQRYMNKSYRLVPYIY